MFPAFNIRSTSLSAAAAERPYPYLPARLELLGALLTAEILIISIWLDADLLRGRGMLATLVHDWGASTLRLGVALALGTLIFAESRSRSHFQAISARCGTFPIGWARLLAHGAAMTLFVWLSAIIFRTSVVRQSSTGVLGNGLMICWALVGVGTFALAAWGLIPGAVWLDLARSTGDAWMYGLGGALVAVTLGTQAQKLWPPLSHWTLGLVAAMLRPVVKVLVVNPATMNIGTPSFQVEIAQECSGYEGMALILAFTSAWLWFFRRQWRFPQALLLLPAGVALMWVVNAVRIAVLILIGNAGAPQIATGGFHSQAGWMAFNAIAIGTCLLARRIPALVHGEAGGVAAPASTKTESSNPTAPYLIPFLAILTAAMVSRALSGSFEWFYPLRVMAAAGAVWYFGTRSRDGYRDVDFRFGPLGIAGGVVVFGLWIWLEPRSAPLGAPAALIEASSAARIGWILLRILGAVALVPIAEELAFRGFLLRRLSSAQFETVGWRTFSGAPLIISSIAFGLMHGERWLAGTLAGAIFALVQIRKGRLGEAIAAHAIANALLATWVLATGYWQLW